MGEAYFYHLTRSSATATLLQLLPRARSAGWRVAVRSTDAAALDRLDRDLWTGPDESFLAHGRATGTEADALQPILLTTGPHDPRECVFSVDGASVSADEVAESARVCILFDGHDETALTTARTQWKALTQAGCKARYWAQESTGWQEKASS